MSGTDVPQDGFQQPAVGGAVLEEIQQFVLSKVGVEPTFDRPIPVGAVGELRLQKLPRQLIVF